MRRLVARRVPWWIPTLVAAGALTVRLVRLDAPRVYVFDEIYYAGDAASLLRAGIERGTPAHPPLGKWLIAAGIEVLGMNPAGWRASAALAGALLCAVVATIAWRLTLRADLAMLAGLLAAVDGILFTSSRLAMLDIFEALFVVLAVHACVVAAQSAAVRDVRRWQLLAALWLGLGAAVKWSALFTVPLLVALIVVQAVRAERPWVPRLATIGRRLALAGAVTIGAYLAAYLPTFATNPSTANPAAFLRGQRRLLDFHLGLHPRNVYAHPAIDWLGQRGPAGLFVERCTPALSGASPVCPSSSQRDTTVAVVSLANPWIWVLGILALAVLLARIVYSWSVGLLIVGGAILTRWAPWLFTRDGYSFYAASLVPFLILAIVLALHLLPPRSIRWSAIAVGAVALAVFAFFYAYLAAVPMSDGQLELRQWMSTWP